MYVIVKNNFVILFLGLDRIPFPSTHSQCFLLLLLFFVLLLVLRRRYAYCSIFEGPGGCPFRAFLYVLPFVVLLLFLVGLAVWHYDHLVGMGKLVFLLFVGC